MIKIEKKEEFDYFLRNKREKSLIGLEADGEWKNTEIKKIAKSIEERNNPRHVRKCYDRVS